MQKYIYNSILIVMMATVSCMYANDAALKTSPIEKLEQRVKTNFGKAEARAQEVCPSSAADIAKINENFSHGIKAIADEILKFLNIRQGNAQKRKVSFDAFHAKADEFSEKVVQPLQQLIAQTTDNTVREFLESNRSIIVYVFAAMHAVIAALEKHKGNDFISLGALAVEVGGNKNLLPKEYRQKSPKAWLDAFTQIYAK